MQSMSTVLSVYSSSVGAGPAARRIPSDFVNDTSSDSLGRLLIEQESTITSDCSCCCHLSEKDKDRLYISLAATHAVTLCPLAAPGWAFVRTGFSTHTQFVQKASPRFMNEIEMKDLTGRRGC